MTQKSKVDAVIREFIDNCKYVPVTAVTSIIGQLGAIADSLDDDEYRKEQLAVGVSHIASGMNADDKPDTISPNEPVMMPNICEWSSKDIGTEVFKQIIPCYLNDDLQVVRILCQAMNDQQFSDCVKHLISYKEAETYHWPVNVDWAGFISDIFEYHKDAPATVQPKPMLTNTTMLWIGKRIDELQNTKRDVVMGYRHKVNILTLEAELNTLQRIIRMEERR